MRAHPQKLVARLTPTAKRALEAAVGRAVELQHGEITPEHLLLAIASESGGDIEALMRASERDPRRLLAELERSMRSFRAGSTARPRLSDSLLRWLEDAWVLASLEWSDAAVRSGALFVQAITGAARYFSEVPDAIEGISPEALRAIAPDVLRAAPEHAEASPRENRSATAPGEPAGPGSALARFTISFTARAREGRLDPVLGRDREIRQMIDVLCRRRKNNPILVGEPGVGKTALVEGLARAIVLGHVPESLRDVDLRALDLGLLEAGASVKGEFEARLKSVISEIAASPRPIVLFVDEAHTLIGAGNQKGGADAANLLKPALARGELRTIAATTFAEHKQYFEKDAALERRFQPIRIEEPSEHDAIAMMRGLRCVYEEAHGVQIRDEAIEAAVRLGKRYLTGRQLPDKSVDLLDTTAARVRIERSARPAALVDLDSRLEGEARRRDALARDLADRHDPVRASALAASIAAIASLETERAELERRWTAQREVLERVLETRRAHHEARRRADAGDREAADRVEPLEAEARRALDALGEAMAAGALVALDVDAAAVARTVELWTGVPVGSMQEETDRAAAALAERLRARVIGQDPAIGRIAESIQVARAGLRHPDAPMGVFLLVGPSGVGKTETAHAIADLLFGGDRFLTTINLSEYQEPHTATRLVGSPPSYVGYGEGGELTEAVRQRPYSVVLLDECEKAAIEVMSTFYQVFDRGVLTDGEGRSIDFRSTCILLTSNLGSDRVAELGAQGRSLDEIVEAIRPILGRHFKPALLNRMTVVPYAPLDEQALGAIVDIELARIAGRARDAHGVAIAFDPAVRARIVARTGEVEGGVRRVRQMLERAVLVPLATAILGARCEGRSLVRAEVATTPEGDLRVAVA